MAKEALRKNPPDKGSDMQPAENRARARHQGAETTHKMNSACGKRTQIANEYRGLKLHAFVNLPQAITPAAIRQRSRLRRRHELQISRRIASGSCSPAAPPE